MFCIMSWNMLLMKWALGAFYLWSLVKNDSVVCMKAGSIWETVSWYHNIIYESVWEGCVYRCVCVYLLWSCQFLSVSSKVCCDGFCFLMLAFLWFYMISNEWSFLGLLLDISGLNKTLVICNNLLSLFLTFYRMHD